MSENPSPETPQSAQSFGSAAEPSDAVPAVAETMGTAPAAAETFGSAPAAVETIGAAPGPVETFGTAPQSTPTPPSANEPAAAESAPKKSRGGLLTVVLLLLVAVVGAAVWFTTRGADVPKVGECIAGSNSQEISAKDVKIVDCGASNASFRVVQRVENTKNDGTLRSCTVEESETGLWIGTKGENGILLCLATVGK